MRPRSTRLGSRADRIATVVRREAEIANRGVTVEHIRGAWERHTGQAAPASFAAEVFSLLRRGILIRIGGRVGTSLYAHRDSVVDRGGIGGDAEAILDALRSAHRRLRRPVSTREVSAELVRRAVQLESDDRNVVRKRLGSLATERQRGPAAGKTPKVRRIDEKSSASRPVTYWEPAGADVGGRRQPRSRAEAIREAIGEATQELGRPVSRTELRWWIDAHENRHPAAELLNRERLSADLSDTAKADRRYVGEAGRVHRVSSALACHGGAPERYTLGSPTPDDSGVCALLDAIYAYQPAAEMAEIEVLRNRGTVLEHLELLKLARLRHGALQRAVRDTVGADIIAIQISRARASLAILDRWFAETNLTRNQLDGRLRYLREAREHLDAVAELKPRGRTRKVQIIGEAAAAPAAHLDAIAQSTARLVDLPVARAARLFDDVRRLPVAAPPRGERIGADSPDPLSGLDRVDAVLACFDAVPLARTSVLLAEARGLLGRVLRDPDAMHRLIRLPRVDFAVRRAAVLALALLGHTVDVELAVPDPADADDTSAYVLASIIALGHDAYVALAAADRRAVGAARMVTDDALRRLEGGDYVCVVG